MSKQPDWIEKRQSLRATVEAMLSGLSPIAQPTDVLMHELLVHKVELEMQVEELRRAHIEMEEARDRYLDLYEFAPVGYLTIARDGLISEINLTGAALLGVERGKLLNRRFATCVSAPDRDRWHRLFMNVMEHGEIEKHAFDIEMSRADASTFQARIDCQRRSVIDAPPILRLALIDMSQFTPAAQQKN